MRHCLVALLVFLTVLAAPAPAEAAKGKPTLAFSSYFGGSDGAASGIAVDATGAVYVTGSTQSKDLPFPNATTIGPGGEHAIFVAKLRPGGTGFEYLTYLDGGSADIARSIAVGPDGSAYILGSTVSPDFPTVHPIQLESDDPPINDTRGLDCIVARLSPDGSELIFSTYLGGAGAEETPGGIAVDGDGNAYVTGETRSPEFPVTNAFDPTFDRYDAFVTKIAADGSSLIYSTFLGGQYDDAGTGIAVDAAGAAYVVGTTVSDDFPLVTPIVSTPPDFREQSFIAKITPDGQSLAYSTYYGGEETDYARGVAVDAAGSAFVVGTTNGRIPGANGFQSTRPGQANAYVAKLTPSGSSLVYATYLGGGLSDSGTAIALDGAGHAFVTGTANSRDFPVARAVQQRLVEGTGTISTDFFVTELSADGKALVYSTYFGGTGEDEAVGIAATSGGDAYVIGYTSSRDFPMRAPLQSQFTGGAILEIAGTSPVITTIDGGGSPFEITISGANFAKGLQVFIADDASPWAKTKRKGAGTIVLKGGEALAAKFPVGVPVSITIRNPDGTSTTATFTR